MFKVVLIASLATLAFAQHYGYGGGHGRGGYGYDDYAQPIPYDYGYHIAGDHGEFEQNRKETGDGHGNVQGSYGYTDAHGNYRQVDYVADGHGFRASVKTNEQGTDNQNPADVDVHSQQSHYGGAPRYGYGGPRHGGYGGY